MEDFTPKKKTPYASLSFIMRPSHNERFIIFTSEHDSFEAFIHQDVKDAISQEAYQAAPNETIGLLAGRVLRDDRGPYTLVLAAQGARKDEVEATPSHVRISANGHAQVRGRLECSAYGLDIIGWYHSHPRFPARFSPVDITEQSTWRDANHLGIVISGNDVRVPLGVYRGPQATLLTPVVQSYEIPDTKKTARLDTAVLNPSIEETESVVTARETVALRSAVRPVGGVSEGIRRLLHWVLAFGLLGTLLSLIWFNHRIVNIEKRLASANLDRESTGGVPPRIVPTPPVLTSSGQSMPQNEATPTDKLNSVDNPLTKAHPLIPGPKRAAKARAKSKTGASAQTNGAKRTGAPDNRPRPQPDNATGRTAKP